MSSEETSVLHAVDAGDPTEAAEAGNDGGDVTPPEVTGLAEFKDSLGRGVNTILEHVVHSAQETARETAHCAATERANTTAWMAENLSRLYDSLVTALAPDTQAAVLVRSPDASCVYSSADPAWFTLAHESVIYYPPRRPAWLGGLSPDSAEAQANIKDQNIRCRNFDQKFHCMHRSGCQFVHLYVNDASKQNVTTHGKRQAPRPSKAPQRPAKKAKPPQKPPQMQTRRMQLLMGPYQDCHS